jgi:hypothetical protein
MVEALRGLGYSTATALADIIDNSIAARATQVDVTFHWRGPDSVITVLDNGIGMDDRELELAMRLGEKSPLHARAEHDLGRFGLGLKTASFSQCRRLTLASVKVGTLSCLRWDLDLLAASQDDGWHLMEGPAPGSEGLLEPLTNRDHGTIVIWENLDRIITPGFRDQDFLDLVDTVETHLGMVFHRYLAATPPRLRLRINGRETHAWDPFLVQNSFTWCSPVANLRTGEGQVDVQCFVLPHQDNLDAREFESGGGPEGWTGQQGIYVYRNERLLVAGSWLGLGRGRHWTKEEAHRLARIRLDISNKADAAWKIDVRKSTAQPPVAIREQLTRLAEDTRERARRVFAHRGQSGRAGGGGQVIQAWRAEHFKGGMRYRIDENHPATKAVLDEAGDREPSIRAMLRVLEETIPVQRIWLDTVESRETPRVSFAGEAPAVTMSVLTTMFKHMVIKQGTSPATARERLLRTEPFNSYPDLVASLPDSFNAEE